MTTQMQPRIDISNVVVDRSENILYKNEDRDAHIPEFARQRLKATPRGKVQISRPGVPSSGAPVIQQVGTLPGENSKKSDLGSSKHNKPSENNNINNNGGPVKSNEVQPGLVAAARRSFLQKSPDPESVTSLESGTTTSSNNDKAGHPLAKRASGAQPRNSAQMSFFGVPAPDTTSYQKPKLPSKTQTQSTSSAIRDGFKITSTKTTTTVRFPTDEHDKSTCVVSHEVVKIDENTEDDITKTSKILGGMQYDITKVIRSVKEPVQTDLPVKKWSKDTPSPRNMPDVMKPAAPQTSQQTKTIPRSFAPKSATLAKEPVPTSNLNRSAISNRLEMILSQSQHSTTSQASSKPPPPSALPPPKRKTFGENSSKGAISSQLEQILGSRNQQTVPQAQPAPAGPPPKRKEFGSGKGDISNKLEQMLGGRNPQSVPSTQSPPAPPPPKRKDLPGTANHGAVTNQLEQMLAVRNQQQSTGQKPPPEILSSAKSTKPALSSPQRMVELKETPVEARNNKGAVTNQLEQMLARKRQTEEKSNTLPPVNNVEPTISNGADLIGETPSAGGDEKPAPPESELVEKTAPRSTPAVAPMVLPKSVELKPEPSEDEEEPALNTVVAPEPTPESRQQKPQQSKPETTTDKSTAPSTTTSTKVITIEKDGQPTKMVQKTVVTKTVNTTVIRRKVPKNNDPEAAGDSKDGGGIKDGGVMKKQEDYVGFCCTIM